MWWRCQPRLEEANEQVDAVVQVRKMRAWTKVEMLTMSSLTNTLELVAAVTGHSFRNPQYLQIANSVEKKRNQLPRWREFGESGKVLMLVPQLCPTLCNPADCSLPASSVHGILQVRILNCVAIPSLVAFPNSGVEPRGLTPLSHQGSPLCIIGIIFTHQDTTGDSWKTWRSLQGGV